MTGTKSTPDLGPTRLVWFPLARPTSTPNLGPSRWDWIPLARPTSTPNLGPSRWVWFPLARPTSTPIYGPYRSSKHVQKTGIGPRSKPQRGKAPRKRRRRKEIADMGEARKVALPPPKAGSPGTARQHTESAVRARKTSDLKIPDLPPAPTSPEVMGTSIV